MIMFKDIDKRKEYAKEYREQNKEKIKLYHQLLYKKEKERISERNKKWRNENIEKFKNLTHNNYIKNKTHIRKKFKENYDKDKSYFIEYRTKNKDKIKIASREYRNKNKEYLKQKNREWCLKNKERVLELGRKSYRNNPETSKRSVYLRRVRKVSNGECEKFSSLEIFNRDKWICQICKNKVNKKLKHPDPMSPSLDHIIPISQGGLHVRKNVQLTHLRCNIKIHTGGIKQLRLF